VFHLFVEKYGWTRTAINIKFIGRNKIAVGIKTYALIREVRQAWKRPCVHRARDTSGFQRSSGRSSEPYCFLQRRASARPLLAAVAPFVAWSTWSFALSFLSARGADNRKPGPDTRASYVILSLARRPPCTYRNSINFLRSRAFRGIVYHETYETRVLAVAAFSRKDSDSGLSSGLSFADNPLFHR